MKLFEKLKEFRIGPVKAANYLNKGVLRNIIYLIFAIALFFFGVLVYGIILNLRNVPLSEAMLKNGFTEIKNPRLVVDRQNYTLGLYEESVLIKNYRVSFGKSVHTPKSRAGDKATPVGVYKICKIDTVNKYHKFFQINYPNLEDATNALRKGWISQKEFNDIKFQYYYEGCTRFNNILGGNIGIHGIGELDYVVKNLPFVFNWTNGSISMSNENIDELYSVIKIGTEVDIK
ncbi:MAG: L,D-transpeptidase [Ignavibacteriaceae bacterium]|nr:L,D-transpeptidase [Ignavibacteriaceae bacterium]MCW8817460.1 L,D-transpeptidase [Ignavibacteriaceae bacterium]MCW8823481.1 L,D-transpeptidase [Ignavibacteriaceae bacterium]MCW8961261.1 L,D-transpeptidase [Ignavibacteriaceae bacterium]MCW9097332.1 L,D-transpeptidase [Ignavibacteriaceae bacterium]